MAHMPLETDNEPSRLAVRLAAACADDTPGEVLSELITLLAKTIGRYPSSQRPLLIRGVRGMLIDIVREIPPLGPPPGPNDHGA